ncbi:MAG: Fe-S cluster assembly ATPase SufC [Erysipelotrichaceae bacterium]|nr:Fe-S cluster assembly ATPase SufC [Erysipelotrichaceae bacterium]
MSKLIIENLHVSVEDKEILKGVDLQVDDNEIHALMGPNGNGKSTLLAAVMGDPHYQITEGTITLDGRDLLSMSVDERSRAGIFLGMQHPVEIPGVTNSDFLRAAINARRETPQPLFAFIREMEKTIGDLQMKGDLAHRFLNEGFSGGEKKRNEILQMKLLKPGLAMLDEIDSGLDVDALQIVAEVIKKMQDETGMSLIVISHYGRFYDLLKPTKTHVLIDGQIVVEGDETLIEKIDRDGYDWISEQYGVAIKKESSIRMVYRLGTCAMSEKAKYHGK